MTVAAVRRLFSVEEYHRLGLTGILAEDDRVELVEGEIVQMTPVGSRHAACVARMIRLLSTRAGEAAILSVQNPLTLDDRSEPLPDVMLLKPRDDFYAERHPAPQDALLVVEVADSSLLYDRQSKLPLYAAHGVPEVWLVDLVQGLVEIHRQPSPQGYRSIRRALSREALSPESLPTVELTVDEILP